MGDKMRLCPACGTFIPPGEGAWVREQGSKGVWFVHNRSGCTEDAVLVRAEQRFEWYEQEEMCVAKIER